MCARRSAWCFGVALGRMSGAIMPLPDAPSAVGQIPSLTRLAQRTAVVLKKAAQLFKAHTSNARRRPEVLAAIAKEHQDSVSAAYTSVADAEQNRPGQLTCQMNNDRSVLTAAGSRT